MQEQQRRGVGRPSLGKVRRYFTISGEIAKIIDAMPAGKRSQYVEIALREKMTRDGLKP